MSPIGTHLDMSLFPNLRPNDAGVVTDAPLPKITKPHHILVKVIAVALNPDWKHIAYGVPSTVGCDFSGIVEEVGTAVTEFKKGDRVFGMAHGSNRYWPENGAFAEYVVAVTVMRIPEGKGFEESATGGVAIVTVGQGLYQEMGLPWPETVVPKEGEKKKQILIWGGSSSMGSMAIQFAKLSGFEVLTTCAKSNFDYVKSLGAAAAFDSRSPSAGSEIRAYTNDSLLYAWDTMGEYGAAEGCAAALASSPPAGESLHYGTILGNPPPRPDVIYTKSLGYTAQGEAIEIMLGIKRPAMPEHFEFAKKFLKVAEKLYAEGKIVMHRMDVRDGGLEKISEGVADLRDRKVSGRKVVYRIAEP
ncbi:putative zinc-binding oxidoreductase ToxD [Byssothecium circinans]|uniref:Putative zinc-binding oxidoreductase ToxD n=1 Tax=Byssothecium circinans TaxID=147558 RepID=A0A6A5UAL3_9PLEO|nr:putative zinc-binding oxidoreductase ToxD [Byssothecium circinans]